MPMSTRTYRIIVVALLVLSAVTVSCDDPTAFRNPPNEDRMTMLVVLDPAFDTQAVWITPFDRDSIRGLSVEVWIGDALVSTGTSDPRDEGDAGELDLCRVRHNRYLWGPHRWQTPKYCYVFPLRPAAEATYEVVLRADGRPTVRGRTTVPAGFAVHDVSARGDPPGTAGLDLAWGPSAGAHRYAVMLRSLNGDVDHNVSFDYPYHGWYRATADTAISWVVPGDSIDPKLTAPWVLDVYALDRALYEHITSGSQDDLFPVPPASNVEGGFGVVGSWVRRSVPVDSL